MRASLILAAHNGGDSLLKTVNSIVETCAGFECEFLLVDDASTDGSSVLVQQRYPQVRVLRQTESKGLSAAKHWGVTESKGRVLVFLDQQSNPEPKSIERLVERVEGSDEAAVFIPAVAKLDTATWTNRISKPGAYRIDLRDFSLLWEELANPADDGERQEQSLYESPSVCRVTFAMERQLYHEIKGFDPQMTCLEDVDFSLTCWMLGFRILCDPDSIIGQCVSEGLTGSEGSLVEGELLEICKVRIARKHFGESLWDYWVERRSERISQSADRKSVV